MSFIKRFRFLAALLALGVCFTLSAAAQRSGGIRGKVTGLDGKPLENAQITFTRTDGSGSFQVKTNKHGDYGDYALPLGTFDVAVASDGKTLFTEHGAVTKPGESLEVNIDLKAQAAAQAALEAGQAPPGMTKEQAAEYQKKLKEQEAQTQKLGQLNGLLKQNRDLVDAKNYDGAIAVMEQAVAIDQKHDILYANLGDDYALAKQYDKAAAAYQQAITLAPTKANYLINLGSALSSEGKVDDANAEFTKAAAMDPTQAKMAMYNSGVVLLNQGNLDGAAAAFTKLLAIDPQNGDAWYYEGIAMLGKASTDPKTGKMVPLPGTVEALQKSLQYAPNGPNAANAKAALATLSSGS